MSQDQSSSLEAKTGTNPSQEGEQELQQAVKSEPASDDIVPDQSESVPQNGNHTNESSATALAPANSEVNGNKRKATDLDDEEEENMNGLGYINEYGQNQEESWNGYEDNQEDSQENGGGGGGNYNGSNLNDHPVQGLPGFPIYMPIAPTFDPYMMPSNLPNNVNRNLNRFLTLIDGVSIFVCFYMPTF